MTPTLQSMLTDHAQARMQQRGIAPIAIERLLRFGRELHDGHGGIVLYFDEGARRRLAQSGEADRRAIDRIGDTYVVLSRAGTVATVGHRYRRLRRR